MNDIKDCRDEVINELIVWAGKHGIDASEAKYDLWVILNNVEITSRCTEIAELNEDQDNLLLKRFLISKQVKGCTKRTLQYYAASIPFTLQKIGKSVTEITTDDIRYYMAMRLRRDKVTKTTIGNEIRNLGSFYNWLYVEELIKTNKGYASSGYRRISRRLNLRLWIALIMTIEAV